MRDPRGSTRRGAGQREGSVNDAGRPVAELGEAALPRLLVVCDASQSGALDAAFLARDYRLNWADAAELASMSLAAAPDLVLLVAGSAPPTDTVTAIEARLLALREREGLRELAVLVVIDALDVEARARLLRAGATDTLSRPFHEVELRARLANLLAASRARGAMSASERQFQRIVSISADAIISMDESQRITLFNEGAEAVFGYRREEMIGQPLDVLIPARHREGHHRGVARFTAGREQARRMGEMGRPVFGRRKNGEEFPADAAISKLTIDGQTIYTATLRDVTEQKRAEEEQRFLAELGALLSASLDFEETLSSVARLSVQRFADLCIVDLVDESGAIRRLRTLSRDPALEWACEILTRVPIDRSQPHLVGEAIATRRPVLMTELSASMVAGYAQGEERRRALAAIGPTSAIVVPLLARGQLQGVMAFVSTSPTRRYSAHDLQLAEGVALRAALALDNARLYRAAQRAIHARDEVLAVVAHDLRNPLSAILMQTQLLKRAGQDNAPRAQAAMESVRRAVLRMNRMIQDLLDVTRIEGGRLAVDRGCVAPEQVIADCVESQRPLTAAASLELRCEVSGEVHDVWADRDRLLQVLENLVGNALKFTPAGGTITLGAAPSEGGVLFWVADSGAGIAAEELPHVFDRFWQGKGGEHRGAGLGLAIVRGLVEAHGGQIWAESAEGRGTTFFFVLPRSPEAERAAIAGPPGRT